MFDLKISKETSEKLNRTLDLMNAQIERSMNQAPLRGYHSGPSSTSQEDKDLVEKFVKDLEPAIKIQAEKLLREEVRTGLLMGGNIERLKNWLKLGKTPKVIRKKEGPKDPLFLQIGDGVDEEIEEIYLLG